MAMIKVEKTRNEKIKEVWEQVDTNPTAIAVLLVQIDDLKKGEKLTITKE